MAILMASLNPTKTGEFVARKVIPKDARAEYKRLYGVSTEAILKVPAGTPKPQAKALHGQWLAEVETRIERIRAAAKGTGQPLTQRNALALAGEWYKWFLARHEDDPESPESTGVTVRSICWSAFYFHTHLGSIMRTLTRTPVGLGPNGRRCAKRSGLRLRRIASEGQALTPDASVRFVDAVSERLFTALSVLEQRANGDYSRDTYPDTFPA
jgi:hypothetical protein